MACQRAFKGTLISALNLDPMRDGRTGGGLSVWQRKSLHGCKADSAMVLLQLGNYMRKCASGGQSLANAERGVEMCGFVGKIDTEFFITNVYLYIIIGNPGPNILVAHFRM